MQCNVFTKDEIATIALEVCRLAQEMSELIKLMLTSIVLTKKYI